MSAMMNVDMQKLMDTISETARRTRSDYHLTLGKLTEALAASAPKREVRFDIGGAVGSEDSYRGYYSDLAFGRGDGVSTAADVLVACRRAATDTYQGYKGGDYTYSDETPLWLGEYGCCGLAIVGLSDGPDGALILVTKDVE